MAYITTSNAIKIVNRKNLKNLNLTGDVYKFKIYMFSRYEENSLLAIQELLKNPEKYFKEIYDPIMAYDSKKYVFKERQPSYHTNISCSRLLSDFKNFKLPQEIIDRGEDEIEKFRNWFKQNFYLLETPDIFVMRLKLAFGIDYNPKSINYENSGLKDFKNDTILELERKIDYLIKEAGRYYYANEKNKSILSSFGKNASVAFSSKPLYGNETDFNDQEVKEFLKDYYLRFKSPLKNFLIQYYRVKFNPTLEFAKNFLEALGFKICGTCENGHENKFIPKKLTMEELIKRAS